MGPEHKALVSNIHDQVPVQRHVGVECAQLFARWLASSSPIASTYCHHIVCPLIPTPALAPAECYCNHSDSVVRVGVRSLCCSSMVRMCQVILCREAFRSFASEAPSVSARATAFNMPTVGIRVLRIFTHTSRSFSRQLENETGDLGA